MLAAAFDQLTSSDLDALVVNAVSEGRTLEFKRDLPSKSEDDVKEFLADVTSLANAQGGDLLYGVEDRKGVAIGLPGVDISNLDTTLLRLENLLRDCIEPRVSGLRMREVVLKPGCGVILIRVPASLAAPHRIIRKRVGPSWAGTAAENTKWTRTSCERLSSPLNKCRDSSSSSTK